MQYNVKVKREDRFAVLEVIKSISEIINREQQFGAYKINVSSHWQSCLPVLAEVFTFTSSNSNSTKKDDLRILPMTECKLLNSDPWTTVTRQ